MENPEISRIFEELADLLEIQGANPFRVRAYRNAARVLRDLPHPVKELADDDSDRLEQLPGIGKDLAEKIKAFVTTGDVPLLRQLREEVPAGLRDLLMVPGLGPRRAQILHEQLQIRSVDELRRAAQEHRIRELAGFGSKTEDAILKSLEHLEESGRRLYLADAKSYADSIVRWLAKVEGMGKIDVAGSFRRRQETIGDLDVLVTCKRVAPVMDRLAEYQGVAEIVARGETKMSIRLQSGLQVDLRVVPDRCYGAALMYFTGSKAHNILLRRRAQEFGFKLSEYGLFKGDGLAAGETEESIFAALDLPWIPPELREGRNEIELGLRRKLPKLIEIDQIHGDLHMHTTTTDGRSSLEDMVAAAEKHGYEYIAVTDHSKRVTMARGLDARRLREHWKRIEKLAGRFRRLTLLRGIELDILEDGNLDLSDDVLSEADFVVASLHYGQNQSKAQITRRLLNAIMNPHVSAIGHPTGRLIGQRKKYDLDMDSVLKAAADYGCCMELNAQPSRLDLDEAALGMAKDRGIQVIISTDAHSVEELAFMEFGVYQARRAGLEAGDVANTRKLADFRELLKNK